MSKRCTSQSRFGYLRMPLPHPPSGLSPLRFILIVELVDLGILVGHLGERLGRRQLGMLLPIRLGERFHLLVGLLGDRRAPDTDLVQPFAGGDTVIRGGEDGFGLPLFLGGQGPEHLAEDGPELLWLVAWEMGEWHRAWAGRGG